jgi:hypothetical protein
MSSGENNIYETLWKQQATVNKLILDGKRDPYGVSRILQSIIDPDTKQGAEDSPKDIKPPAKLIEIQKWCKSISDAEAKGILTARAPEDLSAITNLRRFAKEVFDWKENIFYKVEAGFDFQEHAPGIGPCCEDWSNQGRWALKNTKSTCASLVFWIPRLLPESCSKNTDNQLNLMAAHRKKYELPENCLKDFGSASLNTLLILERFHRTNERVPLNLYWIRTDTLRMGGSRVILGPFGDAGLFCHDGHCWYGDGDEDALSGYFLSGVWKL